MPVVGYYVKYLFYKFRCYSARNSRGVQGYILPQTGYGRMAEVLKDRHVIVGVHQRPSSSS